MGSKKEIGGYHLLVKPKSLGDFGGLVVPDHWVSGDAIEGYKNRCLDIKEQIERHVDNVNFVQLVEESELVCEFCGSKWTEGIDSPHNGGCCNEDAKIF